MTYFNAWKAPMYMKILSAVTGLEMDEGKYRSTAERIKNLIRAFNIKHAGLSKKDDMTIPKRWMEPVPSGPAKGFKAFFEPEDIERSITKYYELRGWNAEGVPTREKLRELELGQVLKDLYG